MKLKTGYLSWVKYGKCICGSKIEFFVGEGCGILVNCETKGRVEIEGLWTMNECCSNPLCEWSKIKNEVAATNLCDVDQAWRMLK